MVKVPQEFEADTRMRQEYVKNAEKILKERPGKNVPRTPEGLVQWVMSEFERRRTERLFFELQWMLNLAFVEGQQYVYINNYINSLFSIPPKYSFQQRDVFNHMAPIYETTMAKYAKINPTFLAKPQSDDIDDINAAQVSKEVINDWIKSEEFATRQLEANSWSALTGTVVWKTIWNPSKGKKVGSYEKDGRTYYIREGEVDNVVIPPFEYFPDSSYNYRMEDCRNGIHAKPVSIDDIYDQFGEDVVGKSLNVFTFDKNYQSLQGNNQYTMDAAHYTDLKRKTDVVMLYEYYENPTPFYPNGRLVICCDGHKTPLYDGELPYINAPYGERRIPFDVQKDIPRAGYFWGTCRLDRAIPIQRRYNAIKNRIAEYMNRFAIGVYAVPAQSEQLEDLEQYGMEPGTILTYNPGESAPTEVKGSALPSTFENESQSALSDLSKTTGVSELSKDSSAPAGTSGRAMLVLQEQDNTKMSLTAISVSQCQVKVCKKSLYGYKQFATFEKIVSIEGAGNAQKVLRWKGSDLNPESIYVENVSALSESIAQKRNWILELASMGAFTTEEGRIDTDRILKLTESGETDIDQTPEDREKTRTKEENAFLKMGLFDKIKVDMWEIHDIAYKFHLEYMLSAEYRSDPEEVQQAFQVHLQMHEAVIQEKMAKRMQQQQQAVSEGA